VRRTGLGKNRRKRAKKKVVGKVHMENGMFGGTAEGGSMKGANSCNSGMYPKGFGETQKRKDHDKDGRWVFQKGCDFLTQKGGRENKLGRPGDEGGKMFDEEGACQQKQGQFTGAVGGAVFGGGKSKTNEMERWGDFLYLNLGKKTAKDKA